MENAGCTNDHLIYPKVNLIYPNDALIHPKATLIYPNDN